MSVFDQIEQASQEGRTLQAATEKALAEALAEIARLKAECTGTTPPPTDEEPDPVPVGEYDIPLPLPTRAMPDGSVLSHVDDHEAVYLEPGATVYMDEDVTPGAHSTIFTSLSNPGRLLYRKLANTSYHLRLNNPGVRVYGVRFAHVNGNLTKAAAVRLAASDLRVEYCSWDASMSRFAISEGYKLGSDVLIYRNGSDAVLGGVRDNQDDIYFVYAEKGTGDLTIAENKVKTRSHFTVRISGTNGQVLIVGNRLEAVDVAGETNNRNLAIRSVDAPGSVRVYDNEIIGGAVEIGYDSTESSYTDIYLGHNSLKNMLFIQIIGGGGFTLDTNSIAGRTGHSNLFDVRSSPMGLKPTGSILLTTATGVNAKTLFWRGQKPSGVNVYGNTIDGVLVES